MPSEFMRLTDVCSDDVFVRKDSVIIFYDDTILKGDANEVAHGCRIVLTTGGTTFVKERAAQVAEEMGKPEYGQEEEEP